MNIPTDDAPEFFVRDATGQRAVVLVAPPEATVSDLLYAAVDGMKLLTEGLYGLSVEYELRSESDGRRIPLNTSLPVSCLRHEDELVVAPLLSAGGCQ